MKDNTQWAYAQLENTTKHSFLTGPAGSGKSTMIRKFIEDHAGKVLVCASTGIAAVNIGGVTIHKLFSFPIIPLGYKQIKKLDPDKDRARIKLFKAAKYIIIDEVSMVRADLMDQIAWFMHKNFESDGPFGGKKIIMVGDIDQLPPVVLDSERETMEKRGYGSPYFFEANCWNPARHAKFEIVKLTKIWRQSDPAFINLLNSVKGNVMSPIDLDIFNNRCYSPTNDNGGVLLCSTNKIASETNRIKLEEVAGEKIILQCDIEGDFPEKLMPVSRHIELKPGCRIMTVMNHQVKMGGIPDYVNGSIGTFIRQDEETGNLVVKFDGSEKEIHVGRYIYENTDYEYNEENKKITQQPVGKFIQFPIKLAYALTIHKSQGQTFDKIIIDLGSAGAFAHGQTYVALSRCRTIDGIILRQKLSLSDFIYDKVVTEFNKKINLAPTEAAPEHGCPFDEPGCFNPETICQNN
jgi:ATP-dependent DNA helicase PIF1